MKSIYAQHTILAIYEKLVSKQVKSERWKDQTERQRIYSGSATRTPSLPYSTPRAPNSRVFFTKSITSLMAEKTVHTKSLHQLTHKARCRVLIVARTNLTPNITPLLLHTFALLQYFFTPQVSSHLQVTNVLTPSSH